MCSRWNSHACAMSMTASSALLPRHGAPAACALEPLNLKMAEMSAFEPDWPHETPNVLPTCVNSVTSTSLNTPARTSQALPDICSSATPGQSTSVPGILSRCMMFFTTIAAATLSGMPELCPSPCPGAPGTSGSCQPTPGLFDACGMSSMSEPNEMTGLPDPHFATNAVGIPATPRSTLNPFCSRIPDRYLDVSNSCIPSSP